MEIRISKEYLSTRKLFIATPMYGGNCLFGGSRIETEDGFKTIKEIVKTKYNKKVKTFNSEKNEIEWNEVTNHFNLQNKEKKKWVHLKTDCGNHLSFPLVTEEHRIAFVEDIFNPSINYIEAKNAIDKNVISLEANPLFNNDQLAVIVGMLLGDGTIKKSGSFRVSHGVNQIEYLNYIKNILGGTISENNISGFQKFPTSTLSVPVNSQTKYFRELLYSSGKKKIDSIIPFINDISLAFWYMDDGYIVAPNRQESPYAVLCTDGFSKEENESLCDLLRDKWNIKSTTFKYRNFYRIRISSLDMNNFFDIISPYIPESMKYKFGTYEFSSLKRDIDNKYKDFGTTKIKKVFYPKKQSGRLYDIEVKNNHNFFAENILVHNCTGVYSKCLVDLCLLASQHGFVPQLYMLFNESLIPRARNYACDEFMRSGADHFLFLDADIGFDPFDIIVMMSMQTDDSPYDVIGAPYAKKTISWEKIVQAVNKGFADKNPNDLEKFVGDFVFNPKAGTQQIQISEPCEVLEIGTGFMMIKKSAMEKFRDHFSEYWYRPDHIRTEHFDGSRPIMQYFQAEIDQVNFKRWYEKEINRILTLPQEVMKVELESLNVKLEEDQKKYSRRYLSEDYWFCQKLQEINVKTWICPWMKTTHMGSMNFSGSLVDLAQIGASPTADPSLLKKQRQIANHIPTPEEEKIAKIEAVASQTADLATAEVAKKVLAKKKKKAA